MQRETASPERIQNGQEIRPANLLLARVVANDRISPSFQRLRLAGDFLRFGQTGLHFRLIYGPERADWPVCDTNGTTIWPGGIDIWHRPPFTIRAIDPQSRWIDTDIFLHDGGRVTEWLSRTYSGDQVGLTGPGGKVPGIGGWVAYAGDETAMPVIARALAVLPENTCGTARIFVGDRQDIQQLKHPAGVSLEWIIKGEGDCPLDAVKSLSPPPSDRFVFFAGERQDAAAVREYLTAAGLGRGEFHSAAYWTDGWSPPENQIRILPLRKASDVAFGD